jgi:hypothetical protein
MNAPNFFIVGAPKCGTTALSEYLREHPSVFFSDPKEPHYFAEDMPGIRYAKTLEQYLALFQRAQPSCAAVGEGSVGYLYSSVALRRISEFSSDCRIVAMVRNPMDMVHSLHAQFLYSRWEDETDFERAWDLQEVRRTGKGIPSGCPVPAYLQYRDVAMLGRQIFRLYEIFPKDRVWVGVFDDLIDDPRGVYLSLLDFLHLTDDGRTEFPRVNESKVYRSSVLSWAANRLKPVVLPHVLRLRSYTGIDLLPVLRRSERVNVRPRARQSVSVSVRTRLMNEFSDDVKLLSNLIDRDLAAWLNDSDSEKSI